MPGSSRSAASGRDGSIGCHSRHCSGWSRRSCRASQQARVLPVEDPPTSTAIPLRPSAAARTTWPSSDRARAAYTAAAPAARAARPQAAPAGAPPRRTGRSPPPAAARQAARLARGPPGRAARPPRSPRPGVRSLPDTPAASSLHPAARPSRQPGPRRAPRRSLPPRAPGPGTCPPPAGTDRRPASARSCPGSPRPPGPRPGLTDPRQAARLGTRPAPLLGRTT